MNELKTVSLWFKLMTCQRKTVSRLLRRPREVSCSGLFLVDFDSLFVQQKNKSLYVELFRFVMHNAVLS